MLLHWLSAWQPFPQFPMTVPVNPDANVYLVALLLALASGFLFGAVPVKQVLHTNPNEVIKAGSSGMLTGKFARRITVRDLLLVIQIAICAVLVTSSFVAVRGLVRSLDSNFGFEPRKALLAENRCEYGWLRGRQGFRDTKAHDQYRGRDSRCRVGGVD